MVGALSKAAPPQTPFPPQTPIPTLHSLHTLHSIAEAYGLTPAEAARSYPIRLNAIVLYSNPDWRQLFIADSSGATFIGVEQRSEHYPVGARLRIDMTSASSGGGVDLRLKKIERVGGFGKLPDPIPLTVRQIAALQYESNIVVTEGVLHPCAEVLNTVCYKLVQGNNAIWVQSWQPVSDASRRLIGATVRITGTSSRSLDDEGKIRGGQILVSSLQDIQVEAPAMSDRAPSVPISSLHDSDADLTLVHQARVRGRVNWIFQNLFAVRDATGTILVRTLRPSVVHEGDTVIVTGFAAHDELGLELKDAAVRESPIPAKGAVLAPLNVRPSRIGRELYGRLVQVEGHLVSQQIEPYRIVYQLKDDGFSFEAVLFRDPAQPPPAFGRGAQLELTGLALPGEGTSGRNLRLLVASTTNMVQNGEYNWLTWQRFLAILAVIVLCVSIPLIWVTQLRRTVRSQTALHRAQLENEFRLATKFQRLFERNLAAVFTWQSDGSIVECNAAFLHLLGLENREQIEGRSLWDFLDGAAQRDRLRKALDEGNLSNYEASLRRDGGVLLHLLMNISPVETGNGIAYETTALDVTQLRQNQDELQRARDAARHDSLVDALTGLSNRRMVLDTLPHHLERAQPGRMVGVLFIDLDGFKAVNDTLGHAVGDALLVKVASRLRSMIRKHDTLARIGGDEFMLVLDGIHDREEVARIADSMLRALAPPMEIDGHPISIGASIGTCVYPDDAADAEELVQRADHAMYAAKRTGKKRVQAYTAEMGAHAQERLAIENQLRGAMARKEIDLHFQPEFDLRSYRPIRFEALARWTHPTLGEVPPSRFIPVAEECGLIGPLGRYLMEEACRAAIGWQPFAKQPLQVGVNVSSLELRASGFVDEVISVLDRTGLPPNLLQIEFTESVMIADAEESIEAMNRLRELGVSLAIDDFGAGSSSLGYLPSFPFDTLKIDRAFVRNLDSQKGGEAMIRALVSLARNFGWNVVVEGVERESQLQIVREIGVDVVQGFLLGRPTADPLVYLRDAGERAIHAVA